MVRQDASLIPVRFGARGGPTLAADGVVERTGGSAIESQGAAADQRLAKRAAGAGLYGDAQLGGADQLTEAGHARFHQVAL
jgi:hypothetical protein